MDSFPPPTTEPSLVHNKVSRTQQHSTHIASCEWVLLMGSKASQTTMTHRNGRHWRIVGFDGKQTPQMLLRQADQQQSEYLLFAVCHAWPMTTQRPSPPAAVSLCIVTPALPTQHYVKRVSLLNQQPPCLCCFATLTDPTAAHMVHTANIPAPSIDMQCCGQHDTYWFQLPKCLNVQHSLPQVGLYSFAGTLTHTCRQHDRPITSQYNNTAYYPSHRQLRFLVNCENRRTTSEAHEAALVKAKRPNANWKHKCITNRPGAAIQRPFQAHLWCVMPHHCCTVVCTGRWVGQH